MKIMICGGGTAGHVYPGLALAEALDPLTSPIEIAWVGSAKGLEAELLPAAGYEFSSIQVTGLQRRVSWSAVKAIYLLIKGIFTAGKLLKRFKPAVVVGMGGYVSLPVMLAARKKYPTIIFEQNSVPGLANRILTTRVSAVAATYEESREYFKGAKKIVVCGNPIRSQVLGVTRATAAKELGINAERLTILIFGGSRGARKINQSAIDIYPELRDLNNLQIVHITGNIEYEPTAKLLSKHKKNADKVEYHLFPYLKEIWLAYAASDFVVGRAGATTLAEITARGLPAILIPYPFATDNHQLKNAQILENAGAVKVLLDEDLNGRHLWRSISDIIYNPDILKEMAERSAEAGRPDAAAKGAELILSLAE